MKGARPRARRQGLIVEPLGEEMLVYDLQRHQAHALNRTAALVWRACDGRADVAGLVRVLRPEWPDVSAEVVDLAVARLAAARLLDPIAPSAPSRRDALRRLAGTAVALLPVVASVVAPEPAQAASCAQRGACCAAAADCCPGLSCVGPQNMPPCTTGTARKRCL